MKTQLTQNLCRFSIIRIMSCKQCVCFLNGKRVVDDSRCSFHCVAFSPELRKQMKPDLIFILTIWLQSAASNREIQGAFGFENPQAIYKWIAGKSLPSLDNFIILSRLLHTSIENILVIDGDIPHLWASLNRRFNDTFPLLSYNRVISN